MCARVILCPQFDETRRINMVLGKTSLNLEAPFSCDVVAPSVFMIIRRAPDKEALRAARKAERKQAKAEADEARYVTYKKYKEGTNSTWKSWTTVTERVEKGTTREDMLQRRASEKSDRFCK